MTDVLASIRDHEAFARLAQWCNEGGSASAVGGAGSSTTLLTAALADAIQRPLLLVVAHLDDADEAVDELAGWGIDAARLPAMEVVPGESSVAIDLLAERLQVVRKVANACPQVIVAPVQALMQSVPEPDKLDSLMRAVHVGDRLDAGRLIRWLDDVGYTRVETIENPGEFAVRGGIIDVFVPTELPVRIDLFGDEVESLFEIDLDTMGSDRKIDSADLIGVTVEKLLAEDNSTNLVTLLPASTIAVLAETTELTEQGRGYFERASDGRGLNSPEEVFTEIHRRCHAIIEANCFSSGSTLDRSVELPVQSLPNFSEMISEAIGELADLAAAAPGSTIVFCQNEGEVQRLGELIREFAPEFEQTIENRVQYLHRGMIWSDQAAIQLATSEPRSVNAAFALVPYHELVHRYHTRRRVRRISAGRAMDTFLELEPGDYVVHRDHGIARFVGLQTMPVDHASREPRAVHAATADSAPEEYLTLEFARGAVIHVPCSKIDLVQKYVGGFRGRPELSTLGGRKWQHQKEKVGRAVRELAEEMLHIQAARQSAPGTRFPADTTWQREFEAEFPYEETEDQITAIEAMKRDMTDARPMDRLICGDVGFGKTEIAIRGAFKAAEYGKQVAVLVPTTVLAEQHERTFRTRFADYPFRIESISRFKTKGEQNQLLAHLRKGQIDIIIGTHRLLSRDVLFKDLGLVIIDEEQRFGVEHKQRLLSLRMTADVLTLSATPIPRTLHMAMLGLRDISSLTTPPPDRRAIVTEVVGYNEHRIRQAIERELAREGQVFFVHNRVHNIQSVADDVRRLVPGARIIIGHGQMSSRELESVMLKFIRRQADILVCTTIIESGIDIPTANTMFINDAHMFGLSELHQLRGRVGRYKHRAYCYMLLPQDRVLSEVAIKRLRAIESYSMLGAGFKIAMRDLEIRGAGNLLGPEQSGHIAAVGYEMYCRLLEDAVRELRERSEARVAEVAEVGRGEYRETIPETAIDIGLSGSLPKGYIPSDQRRMDAYRRVSMATTVSQIDRVRSDLVSAYGELPKAAEQLLEMAELRIRAAELGIRRIRVHEKDVIIQTTRPVDLQQCMNDVQGSLRLVGQPDDEGLTDVYFRPPPKILEPRTLVTILCRRFSQTKRAAGAAC